MAGHSKWANIKHRKAAQDKKRGKLYNKLIRGIIKAAQTGDPAPDKNPILRMLIDKAKKINIPKDKIENAIKKGSGELHADDYEDIIYEGYGANGVAIIVELSTNNKNRTASNIRHIFDKYNGNLGNSGCVAWQFNRRVCINVEKEISYDEFFEKLMELNIEDIKEEEEYFEIIAPVKEYANILDYLNNNNFKILESEIKYLPKTLIKIDKEEDAKKLIKLLDALEEDEDVNNVYSNFDIDDVLFEKISK